MSWKAHARPRKFFGHRFLIMSSWKPLLEMSTAACAVCAALSNVGWQNTLASSVRKKNLSLVTFI
jgi:hypothetical protein